MLCFVASAAIAAAVVAPLMVPSPTARADDTTAVVLKVVDGDTIDIRDDLRGRLRLRVSASTRRKPRSPAIPSAVGVLRQLILRSRLLLGSALR